MTGDARKRAAEATEATHTADHGRTCPALSPETGSKCVLPDTPEAHHAGHESEYVRNSRAVWATLPEDHDRWAADHGRAGLSEEEKAILAEAEKMSDLYPDWRPNARIAAVETILAARMADAWDEGVRHGMTPDNWHEDFYHDDNPYRRQP